MSNAIEKPAETKPQTALDKLDNHAFARNHPELWKIVKWMIVGFIANVPELAVHMLFCRLFTLWSVTYLPNFAVFQWLADRQDQNAGYHAAALVYAYLISTAVGYTIAFVLNRKATFHADANLALSTFLYMLMVILIIFVNGVTGPMISSGTAQLNETTLHLPVGVCEAISKFVCMMAAGVWSYPITRFVVHRQRKPKIEQEGEAA